jgi:hypothetical protein
MDLKLLQATPPWEWPSDAGKILKRTLTNKQADQSDRLIAADLAGDLVVMNDGLADALLAVLREPGEPEELRARAAISFGAVLEQGDTFGFEVPDDVPITMRMFHNIQGSLHKLYLDNKNSKEVRRRILEASVRAPEDWHRNAIQAAYSSGDPEWVLTAVFGMRWVRGFDSQILEALKSADPEIHFEAVKAAGTWEVGAAWPHVVALVKDPHTPKPLLLAAIEAAGAIRPVEAGGLLADLAVSDDEDIAEAAGEAIAMAEGALMMDEDEDGDEEESEWIN